jgi:nitroreductase
MDDQRAPEVDLLRRLRATREFRPDPVPEPVLRDILEVARWSGSAGNRQLWELVVITDRDMLSRLAAVEGGSAKHLAGAPLGLVIANSGLRPQQAIFDEGRLAERIMLAALAHGLGSSIGWYMDASRQEVKRLLGIPDEFFVRTAISIGYPAVSRGGRRKPIAGRAHLERF